MTLSNTVQLNPLPIKSDDKIDKAYAYLRKKAILAHEAHDGVYVIHLAHTALEALKSRQQSIPFKDVRWCFFLAFYWYLDDNTTSLIKEAIRNVSIDQDDRLLVDILLKLFDEPLRTIDAEVLNLPSVEWINRRSNEPEDQAIQSLLLELLWWRSPTSEVFWSNIVTLWKTAIHLPQAIDHFEDLLKRLRFQGTILFGYVPKPDDDLPNHKLAQIFRAFYECRWGDLKKLVKSVGGMTQVEKTGYLSLFGYLQHARQYLQMANNQNPGIHFTGAITSESVQKAESTTTGSDCASEMETPDNQKKREEYQSIDINSAGSNAIISPMLNTPKKNVILDTPSQAWSRYNLCSSRQVSHAHMRQLLENLQDTSIRLVHRETTKSLHKYGSRLGMLGEIHALRTWDLTSLLDIVTVRCEIELEAGYKGYPSMAAQAISDAIRLKRAPDIEKDKRIEKVLECLDSVGSNLKPLVLQRIVKSPPLEWQCAYQWGAMLADALDDTNLLELAEWIHKPEGQDGLTGWRLSYLEFWKDVLPYVSSAPAISDILCTSLVRAASDPLRWSTDQNTLFAAIKYGSIQTATSIIRALQAAQTSDPTATDERWRIIYQACFESPHLLPQVREWLISNTPNNYCQHFIKRLEIAKMEGPIDDVDYRNWLIKRLNDLIAKLTLPRGSLITVGDDVNGYIFRLVIWTVEHRSFFEGLISAINAENGSIFTKAAGLMILASAVESGDNAIVDTVLVSCKDWLALGYVPAIDPWERLRTDDEKAEKPLERELWFLVHECTLKRPSQMRSLVWQAAMQGNYRRSSDIVFSTIVRLALSVPEAPDSLAMITFTECLILNTDDKQLSRFVRTFATVLKAPKEGGEFAPLFFESVPAKMLLEFWTRHLPILAKHPRFDIRFEVAQALTIWRDNNALSFPTELCVAQNLLLDDPRARVRWAVRQCKGFQSELVS